MSDEAKREAIMKEQLLIGAQPGALEGQCALDERDEQIRQLKELVGELEPDAVRLRWLIRRGVAWRDCYREFSEWYEGEWNYGPTTARADIDIAMAMER